MLRHLNNKRAQAVLGEYLLVIFLAIAVIIGMTIYFKRGVQARIHGARDYMVGEVRTRTTGFFSGNLYKEYEPYYTDVVSNIARDTTQTIGLSSGTSSGIFQKDIDLTTVTELFSNTAPPSEYNRTTPIN